MTDIAQTIQLLPLEAQNLVSEWVQTLQKQYDAKRLIAHDSQLQENDPFFGIWSDRSEMKDSIEYVRNLRNEQWG